MIGETMFVSGSGDVHDGTCGGKLSVKMDPRMMMGIGFFGFACGTIS